MSLAVTVYSNGPTCNQCTATERHLGKREIPFTSILIDHDDEQLMASFDALGHSRAPIVCATTPEGEQDWSGYRPDRIDALMRFHARTQEG